MTSLAHEVITLLSSSSDEREDHHPFSQPRPCSSGSFRSQQDVGHTSSQSLGKKAKLAVATRSRAPAHSISESDDDSDCSLPSLDFEHKLPSLSDRLRSSILSVPSDHLKEQHVRRVGKVHSLDEDETTASKTVKKPKGTKQSQKGTSQPEKALERLKQREKKKEEKELSKALKHIEREVKKNDKPQERLKSMRVVLDSHFEEIPESQDLLRALQGFDFKHSVERNHVPYSIIWNFKVTDVDIVNNKARKIEREELQSYLLLYMSKSFFTDRVNASVQKKKKKGLPCGQTLLDYITSIKTVFPQMNITCVTVGLEDYFREKAEERKKKKDCQTMGSVKNRQSIKNISRKDVEEAMIEVQLQAVINFKLLDNMSQFADLLAMFTKAIAEAPLKFLQQSAPSKSTVSNLIHQFCETDGVYDRPRSGWPRRLTPEVLNDVQQYLQQLTKNPFCGCSNRQERHRQQGFSWYADADSSCPIRIAKDGTGLINLWQQQICQFQNVGKEVAQAIAAEYPSPMMLMEAYRKCTTKQQAEKLLQDIVVRRGFGPLGTTRRIGPELSYKICLFFTSNDGNLLIQR